MDPLKYMMNKTYQNSRTIKWIMHLTEFDLHFIGQKLIKGQVITDYLIDAPLQDNKPLVIELPDDKEFQLDELEIPIKPKDNWDMTI